jgi:hypothetical protein
MTSRGLLYPVYAFAAMALLAGAFAMHAGAEEKKQRGPRALAVLEMGPAGTTEAAGQNRKPLAAGVGFPRLIPILVLDGGEYYDATAYKATPVPLAVQAGTVYDVQSSGVQKALFTVQQPTRFHGSWVATGTWQPASPEPFPNAEVASQSKSEDEPPPHLRRSVEPAPQKPASKPAEPAPTLPPSRSFAAISDAESYDTRPYLYSWTPRWRRQYTNEMLTLAQRELSARVPCKAGGNACPAKLEAAELHAFDLDTNNDAELVLTARSRQGAGNLYITVVGRVGWQAHVEKVFATVTDDAHLDTNGRLEFVDAVDADGDGHGELLFRRVHNRTQSFELYRVGHERMWKLFDGAESNL